MKFLKIENLWKQRTTDSYELISSTMEWKIGSKEPHRYFKPVNHEAWESDMKMNL